MKGLKTRAISAAIFVILIVGGIYGGVVTLSILLTLICFLCLLEFYTLFYKKEDSVSSLRRMIITCFGLIPMFIFPIKIIGLPLPYLSLLVSGLVPAAALLMVFELYQKADNPFENVSGALLGLFYISIPIAFLADIVIQEDFYRPNLVMGILLFIWANDTFAYLVGSAVGKNKLFPRISPGKTWEGTIGGGICAILLGLIFPYLFGEMGTNQWLIVGALCVIFGSLGDLTESMLKRSKGVKDSGNLMPGHGGALDRFDAFIFALPFVCFYLMWAG